MYGEGAVTDQTCQKWFAKFHTGDFLLDYAPRLGRPIKVDSNQIKTFIENNQCYTSWEGGKILKISKSSSENYLHQLDYVINNHFNIWVSHKLSKNHLLDHNSSCDSLLKHKENVVFKTNCDG